MRNFNAVRTADTTIAPFFFGGAKQLISYCSGRAGGGWDEEGEGDSSSEDELSEFYGLYQYGGADQQSSPEKE